MKCIRCNKEIQDGEGNLCEDCKKKFELSQSTIQNDNEKKVKVNIFKRFYSNNVKTYLTQKEKVKTLAIVVGIILLLFIIMGALRKSGGNSDIINKVGNLREYGYADKEGGWIYYIAPDEELAKIVKVEGKSVYVEGIVSGITQLIAETPDNQKFFFWISVSDVGLHFVNSRGIVPVNIGESASTILVGYEFENKSYQIGESPVKYTIDDENIAEIINFEGDDINIRGISVGETTLRAETPEGETAEIKIVVSELVETTTIPIETTPIYNSTTTVDLCGGDIYTSYIIGDANSDFKVSISDSVKILQNIANSEKYTLTEQEKINADCYDPGSGITGLDAAAIQKFDAGIIDKLPETIN